ncbi:hypothetical protein EDB92DRAFT_1819850 [Lactarius akahatsu]|uniref:Uncharacterized protein n=1 Tax=Lactarius akahatsu TaxID=416441 RepID=A0AAD4Q966_9AGAM|nr:hypothetical protein EDB92DRAFT_1819850 [Lactarius akahatsu]
MLARRGTKVTVILTCDGKEWKGTTPSRQEEEEDGARGRGGNERSERGRRRGDGRRSGKGTILGSSEKGGRGGGADERDGSEVKVGQAGGDSEGKKMVTRADNVRAEETAMIGGGCLAGGEVVVAIRPRGRRWWWWWGGGNEERRRQDEGDRNKGLAGQAEGGEDKEAVARVGDDDRVNETMESERSGQSGEHEGNCWAGRE